jgi:hypothetical protein
LPDGFFSDQKSQFGYVLEDLGMEHVVIYSVHLEYFRTIEYILWAFGNFVFIRYIFPRFDMLYQRKSGNLGFDLGYKHERAGL